ncbi:MAG TPA: carboxypeptidase regulatory-like domain-containing protein [Terriglobales bacterium]|nr:carboxypeptidase regulatory-like domain-containing protein [Terriglobales bacterium]
MKKHFVVSVLMSLIVLLVAPSALAQNTGTVKGVCKDVDGKPIAGAQVEWLNVENGRKYELKTNNKGEYFSLGVSPGKYTVTLSKDGKEIFHYNGFAVTLEEATLDFDMKKEQAAQAQGAGLTPEQLKQRQEQEAKVAKENTTIKSLNEKLAAAKQAADAGDFNTAKNTMAEATQVDPNRDLLWAKLGDYTASAASKETDAEAKKKDYADAVGDYQKAVDLKQKTFDADPAKKTPDATKVLAQYYNNLGQAQSKALQVDDAAKSYTMAAQLDPAGAAQYYFNLGAVMTNAGKVDDGIAAFDKAIAADPNRAEAYYWKGVNLIGKATLQGDKMVAPEGTAEAFNKYLELQPNGPFAEPAKQMLASIGASIETSYGSSKKKPTKK